MGKKRTLVPIFITPPFMDTSPLPRRRDFLQTTGLGLLGWPVLQSFLGSPSSALAQTAAAAPAASASTVPALNRFPRMMQDWLVAEVRAAEQRGNARREALKTKADAE